MMPSDVLHAVLTFLAGVCTGVLSAAFGVGGAVISTPAIRLLGVSAAFAVGTTLPSVLPSAATGAWRYSREGIIRWDVVAWAAPAGIVTAVAGSLLSKVIPGEGHWLMIATAVLLGFTAWRMAKTPRTPGAPETDAVAAPDQPAPPDRRHDRPAVLVGIGAAAGLLSGLLGIGGGVAMVPGFTELARIPLKTAIATSLACVGIFAVPGTITHALFGDIDWRTAAFLSLGVVPGARLGAALAIRAGDRRLRLAVAGFLGLTAVAYAVGEVLALS
ncbi:MAG TPA: sulfite exporter TauE/SafE family protein [Acidimicrobiales bacterium]|nr:sulfite exporter TauE/SafE family protein [Acidimicrobiales bacterium]